VRVWVVLLCLAGCNQIYGLDNTILVENDRDDDGLLDVIDNCVDVSNPLQENQDGDALGDACDPCVQGANSDEDSDGLLDGCDNCPYLANVDQANVDGDDLGDVCDPDNAVHHVRVRFDGFAEPLTAAWIPGYADWEVVDGAVHAVIDPPVDDYGLWSRTIEAIGTSWMIETAVEVEDTAGTYAGLYTRVRIGSPEHACYLQRTTAWTLNMASNGMATSRTLASLPPSPIRLRLHRTATAIVCEIPGVAELAITNNDGRTGAGLYVSSTVPRFHYVDAVSSD
jgi:hypothetical protein